jgi:hypothetical protein
MRLRRNLPYITFALAAAMALLACYTGSNDIAATDTAAAHAAATAAATTNGLPCSVADVLSRSCLSCHGSPPTGGAANSMLTYEDLTAASAGDPSKTEAALAIARMGDTSKPMPPSGPSPASDADALARPFRVHQRKDLDPRRPRLVVDAPRPSVHRLP